MANEELRTYLEQPEGQFLDRKSGRIAPRDLATHLIAFANADGGTIVLGVENDGRITGMGQHAARENQLLQAGSDFCEPGIRVHYERLPCVTSDGDPDHLLVLNVVPSQRVHAQTNGDAYLRVGDQTRKLTFDERVELGYDKGETTYESTNARDAILDDLDADLLEAYRVTLGIRGTVEDALIGRDLARRRDGRLVITYGGVLLFGRQPTQWLPRAEVRILRYEGVTRETGARMNLVKDIRVGGPLARQLPEALRTVGSQLREFTRLAADGRFRTTPDYPEFAWREAVTNAVSHRSYSLYGVPVEVLIFDDRLEVQSPGRLPGTVRVHNIRESHFARNPRVARVLADLGFVSDIGEGVDRMYEEMAGAHLPPPEFEDSVAGVRVTLRRAPVEARADPDPVAEPSQRVVHLPAVLARTLNPRQRAALQFLRTHDRIVTRDVMQMFAKLRDPRTVSLDLNGLVQLGLLHRVGRTQDTYYHADGKVFLFPDEV